MKSPRVTQRHAAGLIAQRQPFTAAALSGTLSNHGAGRLLDADAARWRLDRDRVLYVVYSYGTPIAWLTADGWQVVEQRFSVTTSRHQSIVRRAVAAEVLACLEVDAVHVLDTAGVDALTAWAATS